MNTIIESAVFSRKVFQVWDEPEYEAFKAFIALNPYAGQVVRDTGGVRKIRWRSKTSGKRGGVRVIYYNKTQTETWLLAIYSKTELDTLSTKDMRKMREVTYE